MATAASTSLEESGLDHDLPQAYTLGESATPLDRPSIAVPFTIPNPTAASEPGPGRRLVVPESAMTQDAPPAPEKPPKHSLQIQTPAVQLQIRL